MIKLFLATLLLCSVSMAQVAPIEIDASQVKFNYLSSEGDTWLDCTTTKKEQTHGWLANCGQYKFDLHMFLKEYTNANETTIEFNYWATETEILKETHTQSSWITVDSPSSAKKIVGYLGFVNDSMQLRVQIDLKK